MTGKAMQRQWHLSEKDFFINLLEEKKTSFPYQRNYP